MQLKDPVSVYIAGTNLEAQMICSHLISLGIPAYAIEDVSGVGTYALGVVSQFHKPEVYVERSQAEEAAKLIVEYEDTLKEAQANATAEEHTDYCPACGERVAHGTPTCPECERPIDWPDGEESDEDSFNFMSRMKEWKKPILIMLFVGPFVLGVLIPILFELLADLGLTRPRY